MAVSKDKKKEILDKLTKIFKEVKSLAFVNFHKLSVHNAVALRKVLRLAKVEYMVAKKTLIKKAIEGTKFEGVLPKLEGEIAVAYSADEIAPTREIFSFGKKIGEGLKLVGGIFGGKFIDEKQAEEIALIPNMDTLRGQFVNIINSPIQGFVMAIDQIAKKKV